MNIAIEFIRDQTSGARRVPYRVKAALTKPGSKRPHPIRLGRKWFGDFVAPQAQMIGDLPGRRGSLAGRFRRSSKVPGF